MTNSADENVIDTPELRAVEEQVLSLATEERLRLLKHVTALLPRYAASFEDALARLSTPEALDQALRAHEAVARSLAVLIFAAQDPDRAREILPTLASSEQRASKPDALPVSERPLLHSPGATAHNVHRWLASLLPWRTVLDRMDAGDLRMMDLWPAVPTGPEEQAEMMRRLLPRAKEPSVAQVLSRVITNVVPGPAVEADLIAVYETQLDGGHFLQSARSRAAQKLLERATPEALQPLIRRVESLASKGADISASDYQAWWAQPVAAILLSSTDLLTTAKAYTTPERLRRPSWRRLAREILPRAWGARVSTPTTDEAWATYLVELWSSPLSLWARDCLLQLPEAVVLPKLRAKLGPKRVPRPLPVSPNWLPRYQAGEHEAVWHELGDLGTNALESDEALAVARETMQRVKREIERIGAVLNEGKYRFHAKKKWYLPATEKAASDLAKLEKKLALRLPLALRAFYEIVGSVDLTEVYDHAAYDEHAAEERGAFAGLGRLDPLEVLSWKEMADASKPYLEVGASKAPEELRPVPQLCFGYAPECKYTGEDPDPMYRMELRFYGADAPVVQSTSPPIGFVGYLRLVLGAGGFRGLSDAKTPREIRQRDALTASALRF